MTHRLPRLPELTTQRMIAALALLIVGYFVLVGVSLFAFFSLYLTFVIVTILVVRSVPVQPGDWLAVRSVRRTVVAVIVLLLAFLAISPYGPDSVGEVPIVLLLLGFGFVILGRATQRVASAPDALVDERQETLRNRSHRIAYLIFAFLVCATVLGGYTLGSGTRSWLGQALRGAPLYTFFLLLFFLPAMVLAWLEPDRLTAADAPKLAPTTRSKIAVAMVALAFADPHRIELRAPSRSCSDDCSHFPTIDLRTRNQVRIFRGDDGGGGGVSSSNPVARRCLLGRQTSVGALGT